MLNELKTPSPAADEELRDALREYMELVDVDRGVSSIMLEMRASRAILVERCRLRVMERLNEEAWLAALRWYQFMEQRVSADACNVSLGTALAMVGMIEMLRVDGAELATTQVITTGPDGRSYPVMGVAFGVERV